MATMYYSAQPAGYNSYGGAPYSAAPYSAAAYVTAPYGGAPAASSYGSGACQLGASSYGGTPYGTGALASNIAELRRLFLGLQSDDVKQSRASQIIQSMPAGEVSDAIPALLEKLVTFPTCIPLGAYMLGEFLRVHPDTMLASFPAERVYDIFNQRVDDAAPAQFLYNLLRAKEARRMSTQVEATKLQKLLARRAGEPTVLRAPASTLRSWLCQIWLDVPSSRPDAKAMADCCARWVADPDWSLNDKLACLQLLRAELDRRGSPEGEVWLVSNVFAQACRSPDRHSSDLQQLLFMLSAMPSPFVLQPVLGELASDAGRLLTLWVCLCTWMPQAPVPHISRLVLPPGAPAPVHSFLALVLQVYSQLAGAEELCSSCLLSSAAVAAGNTGRVSAAATELLLVLHKTGPALSARVWMPVSHLLEGLCSRCPGMFPAAMELIQRLYSNIPAGAENTHGGAASPSAMALPYAAAGGQSAPSPYPYEQASAQAAYYEQPSGAYGSSPYRQQYQQSSPSSPYGQQQNWQSGPASSSYGQQPSYGQGDASSYQMQSWGQVCGGSSSHAGGVPVQLERPPVGLRNINNTCYMNTVVQALFLTTGFLQRVFGFELTLKPNASKVDKEDYNFGLTLVELLRAQLAKMSVTKQPHVDIQELLDNFPADYRSGQQQDVTEALNFVLDKLGGHEQALVSETFGGGLSEMTQCQVCGNVKRRSESFTDLVLKVPTEEETRMYGQQTAQQLFDRRMAWEEMSADDKVWCDHCQREQRAGRWSEVTKPPAHLCVQLNRFNFDAQKMTFTKEKTPVRVDCPIWIGNYHYELYLAIVHTGKDASSGHYYAIGSRSELPSGNASQWFTLDDSQVKPPDYDLLSGQSSKTDDNPYVLFYRCVDAPPSGGVYVPQQYADKVWQEDAVNNY